LPPRRRISRADGQKAISDFLAGEISSETEATAVRYLLEELSTRYPGNSVEVRIPPLGAIQCIEGPAHSRGTPANVIEMKPETWLKLALGIEGWEDLYQAGKITASGNRSDLSGLLPIFDI
jgi:hypothetical protein